VRVVRIGGESIELCGGTHVALAGEIGLFRVVSEEPLALGVRRVVAVSGQAALELDQHHDALLRKAAHHLRVGPEQVVERIDKLLSQIKAQDREIAQLKKRLATGGGTDLLSEVRDVSGVKVLATRVAAADPKTLRDAGDALRDRLGSGIIVLGGEHEGKATLLVMVTKDLTDRFHAGKLVGKLAELVGGRGGGRPDLAQAGGPRVDALDDAIARACEEIRAVS
jgi:alanyl-tRNA synthetase